MVCFACEPGVPVTDNAPWHAVLDKDVACPFHWDIPVGLCPGLVLVPPMAWLLLWWSAASPAKVCSCLMQSSPLTAAMLI